MGQAVHGEPKNGFDADILTDIELKSMIVVAEHRPNTKFKTAGDMHSSTAEPLIKTEKWQASFWTNSHIWDKRYKMLQMTFYKMPFLTL